MASKADGYENRQISRGKNRHAVTFRQAIDEFLYIVKAKYADQLTEQHIPDWYAALRKKGNANRTIYRKHVSVFGYLSWAGVDTKKLAAKARSYTERAVQVYKPEEIDKFFKSLKSPYHRMVFETLLRALHSSRRSAAGSTDADR
jgi:hypothetical protein